MLSFKKHFLNLILLTLNVSTFFIFNSCASFSNETRELRTQIKNELSNPSDVFLDQLKTKAQTPSKDQLLYALNYATVLQIKGNYKESAQAFIAADQIVSEKDYHSVSQILGATLGAEEMIQYKGESYEKFLLNTMNALNFLFLNQYDEALVECRRINNRILELKAQDSEPYKLSPWARYFAAMVWESQKKYDDAFIEYEGAYQLDPYMPFLQSDLIRVAQLAQRSEQLEKYKSQFKIDEVEAYRKKQKKEGEIIVVYLQGFGALKVPRFDEPRFPTVKKELSLTTSVQLFIDEQPAAQSVKMYDIDQVALVTLLKDYNSLVARRVGGLAAKAVVSDQLRQKNQALGDIAWIAMNLADRADLRQWGTLPANIQLIRIWKPEGRYKVQLKGLGESGQLTEENSTVLDIDVKAGAKIFVPFRSLR